MLQVKDLHFRYKHAQHDTLSGLNFSQQAGAITGLLGVNGAGKSTLVSLIVGLLDASTGSIRVNGLPARLGRADIGYVPQEYAFYEKLSVRQNLEFFAAAQRLSSAASRRQAVDRVTEQCQLAPVLARTANECSGGEKRRLNLAIALLRLPKLLILDEPTANVDPRARAHIVALVQELNRSGITILYASHLLHEIQQLCDSLVLIHKGRLLRQGDLPSLIREQSDTLTVQLKNFDNSQQAMVIDRLGQTCHVHDSGLIELPLQPNHRSIASVLREIESIGLEVASVHSGGDLEAVFLDLTQSADTDV